MLGISTSEAATIRGPWFRYFGVAEPLIFDPVTNARVGRWIWEYAEAKYGDGGGPWVCKP